MCSKELAKKTKTAASKIGSQREARVTMRVSEKVFEERDGGGAARQLGDSSTAARATS
jgi:hypothetical protein